MSNKWIVYLLALSVFLIGTVEYIISGILPLVATDLGITTSAAGTLVTAFALAAAVGSPILIAATIRVDRKKMLIVTLGIFVLSSILVYMSHSIEVMLLTRMIQGLSGGAATVIAMAVATRLVDERNRGRAIGTILMGLSSSLVLGVPVGTFLSEAIGWRNLFIIVGLLAAIPMVAVYMRVPPISEERAVTFGMQLSILKNKRIVMAIFITLFYIGGYSALFTYISPFLQSNFALSAAWLSIILLLAGVCSFVGSKVGGIVADRRGPQFTIYAGLSFQAGTLLLLSWSNSSLYVVIPLIMIWMAATWMTSPAQQLYLVTQVPQSPDIALSINTSFIQFGFAIGSGVGGFVINHSSVNDLGWSGLLLGLVALLLAVWLFRFDRRAHREAATGNIHP